MSLFIWCKTTRGDSAAIIIVFFNDLWVCVTEYVIMAACEYKIAKILGMSVISPSAPNMYTKDRDDP